MTTHEIKVWLSYWAVRAAPVNVCALNRFEDIAEARKWCPPFQPHGMFGDVSDEDLWEAVREWWSDRNAEAHARECEDAAMAALAERAA